MIFAVLYKYLNYGVDKTIDTGHITDCNTNYRVILLMVLFITSWCKPLKTDQYREICSNIHPDKLICVCYCST